jgi:putative cell wall-binding protein
VKLRTRRAISVLAGALLLVVPAHLALAVTDVKTDRLAGNDRYATAAAAANAAFPGGASTVLIASGETFPDALAGAALAGFRASPVLLTTKASLPAATSTALDTLKATNAVILGGTGAVSAAVQSQLDAKLSGTVTRIAGNDRYATAAAVAREIGTANIGSTNGRKTALIATGTSFADALAGGPLAAAGSSGRLPILLVGSTVPQTTRDALTDLAIKQVIILGGTSAVSAAVQSDLETVTGNPAQRVAGNDRFATAALIADESLKPGYGFNGKAVLLANGLGFADALAAGPLGGVRKSPVLLTAPTALSAPTKNWLEGNSAVVETVTAIGGTSAVTDATLAAAETAGQQPPKAGANETITITPRGSADLANGSSRDYTATGLTAPVDIVLLDCNDVTTQSGNTVFANANANTTADRTAESGTTDKAAVANVRISAIGGTPRADEPVVTNNDYANAVAPTSGSVTFTVSGPSSSSTAVPCVIPVVFVDANADNALNVPSGGTAPNEGFGAGGRTTFGSTGATGGQFGPKQVQTTDKANDRFVACAVLNTDCTTYRYDGNDVFQISSTSTTLSAFESALSPGDSVQGSYNATSSGQSTFNLTDGQPATPATPVVTVTSTTVMLTFADASGGTSADNIDTYRAYRAPKTTTACPDFNTASGRASYALAQSVADADQSGTTSYTITDTGLTSGTSYCYSVVSVSDGDESTGTPAVTATPGGAVLIVSATTSAPANTAVAIGNQIIFDFNQAVTIATGSAFFEFTDSGAGANASVGRLTCGSGGNATCGTSTLANGNTRLTITVTGLPTYTTPGESPAGIATYPLTVNIVSDGANVAIDEANSPDRTVDSA